MACEHERRNPFLAAVIAAALLAGLPGCTASPDDAEMVAATAIPAPTPSTVPLGGPSTSG